MSGFDSAGFDYEELVIGSGFGGSVSALRLTEKGYRVGVLEQGRRFADDDLPTSSWQLRDYLSEPRLGCLRHLPLHAVDVAVRAHRCGGVTTYPGPSVRLGVNPSLTITAQAERATALWPNRGEADTRPPPGAPYLWLDPVAPREPVVPAAASGALRSTLR